MHGHSQSHGKTRHLVRQLEFFPRANSKNNPAPNRGYYRVALPGQYHLLQKRNTEIPKKRNKEKQNNRKAYRPRDLLRRAERCSWRTLGTPYREEYCCLTSSLISAA